MDINLFIKSYIIHSMLTVILLTVATTLTQLIETHSPPQDTLPPAHLTPPQLSGLKIIYKIPM